MLFSCQTLYGGSINAPSKNIAVISSTLIPGIISNAPAGCSISTASIPGIICCSSLISGNLSAGNCPIASAIFLTAFVTPLIAFTTLSFGVSCFVFFALILLFFFVICNICCNPKHSGKQKMGIIPKSGNKANCAHYAERPCKELVLPFVRKNNVGHFLYSFNYPFHFLILQSKQIIGGTTAHFANYYYPFRDNPFGRAVT